MSILPVDGFSPPKLSKSFLNSSVEKIGWLYPRGKVEKKQYKSNMVLPEISSYKYDPLLFSGFKHIFCTQSGSK